jgi:hypothetical protein
MKNSKLKIKNECLPSANHKKTSAKGGHHNWSLVIGHWSLLLILLFLAQPALAMGGPAPSKEKEQPKYKVEILKMEIVSQPVTHEVTAPKKIKLKK